MKTARALKMAETKKKNAEANAGLSRAFAEAAIIVASAKCPYCGAGLKRNLSLTGWWQCEQFGNEQFRKDAAKPACSFQCFVDESRKRVI